jgi:hypothetical protein
VGVVLTPVVPFTGLGDAGVPGGNGNGRTIAAVVLSVSLAGKSSVTVSVIRNTPTLAYVCDAVAVADDVLLVPSPQAHR